MFYLKKPSNQQISTVIDTQSALAFTYPAVGSTKSVRTQSDGRLAPASTAELPERYVVDHNRVLLGHGQAVFEAAKEAIRQWQMFNLGWVQLCGPSSASDIKPDESGAGESGTGKVEPADSASAESAPIEVGTTVGVLASSPFWLLNTCRIVYTVDEKFSNENHDNENLSDEKSVDEKRSDIFRFGFGYGTLPTHVERGEERFQVEWHQHDDSVWYDIVAFSQPNHLLTKVGYPVVRQFQKRFARDSKAAMVQSLSEKPKPF